MSIINRITLKNLLKNRTRTIVTIIGAILSAAMVTAVVTLVFSFQQFLVESGKAMSGDWHITVQDVTLSDEKQILGYEEVESMASLENIGYAQLENSQNPYKRYINIEGFSENFSQTMPIKISEGRLPENENEILIPSHLSENGGISLKVGEKIKLAVGDITLDGKKINQNDALDTLIYEESDGGTTYTVTMPKELAGETFSKLFDKEFTVVGIYERPNFEPYSAPGYTALTVQQNLTDESDMSYFIKLYEPNNVYKFAENFGENAYIDYNTDVLRFMGISDNGIYNSLLYTFGGILIAIIMIASISLIYNAFAISVTERTRLFGLLSSIGASKKQLRLSVIFEAFCIAIVGIPFGIGAGILGIGITLSALKGAISSFVAVDGGLELTLKIAAAPLVASAIVSLVTILISAYIPSVRAGKITPIEAIRQAADVKITKKAVKTSKLSYALFGLSGELAAKNFKRNKKRYRATVFSLVISIILFMTSSYFMEMLTTSAYTAMTTAKYDVYAGLSATSDEIDDIFAQTMQAKNITDGVLYSSESVTVKYDGNIYSDEYIKRFGEGFDPGETLNLDFAFIDDENFDKLAALAGVDKSAFYNSEKPAAIAAGNVSYQDYTADKLVNTNAFSTDLYKLEVVSADGKTKSLDVPKIYTESIEFLEKSSNPALIMPLSMLAEFKGVALDNNSFYYYMGFHSTDHEISTASITEILDNTTASSITVSDYLAEYQIVNNIMLVINVFAYGFIILMSLITVANVFNTISTGIILRNKEFAMLESVGMGKSGMNKMMNYESLLFGAKSLIIGLPISLLLTWLINKSISSGVLIDYSMPWKSVAISVITVFAVVFASMLFSMHKIKKQNIVETLRRDNT